MSKFYQILQASNTSMRIIYCYLGIGRQLVQRFYIGGATVCTLDKNPATVEQLRTDFPNIKAEVVDLSDWEATKEVVESFGEIDHVINSAGVIITEELLNIKKESAALYV